MTRRVYTIFSDDFRQEIGNKTSVMGIYIRSLNVPAFPATLSKLCINSYLETPLKEKFEVVSFRIRLNDTLLSEEFLPKEFVDTFWMDQQRALTTGELAQDDMVVLSINAIISPLIVEQNSVLRMTIEVDGDEIDAGKIRILAPYSPT